MVILPPSAKAMVPLAQAGAASVAAMTKRINSAADIGASERWHSETDCSLCRAPHNSGVSIMLERFEHVCRSQVFAWDFAHEPLSAELDANFRHLN